MEVTRSPQSPHCQYFSDCGGCDWLDLEYAEQLRTKEAFITQGLDRLALKVRERLPILAAEQVLHYRTRIQVSRAGDRLGFYRKNSKEVVDVESCAVARPEINALLGQMREELKKGGVIADREELVMDSEGVAHRRSIDMFGHDFAQIHQGQNEKLKTRLSDWIGEAKSQSVIELYCGNGNLTFAYQKHVQSIWAVDASPFSIQQAKAQNHPKIFFDIQKVSSHLHHQLPLGVQTSYDTLVLDPPRQGTGGLLREWVPQNVKNIFYISCAPQSFIQDLTHIREWFSIHRLQAIDMFPQTRHVEIIAWLRRH